jgi:hypothetical protein
MSNLDNNRVTGVDSPSHGIFSNLVNEKVLIGEESMGHRECFYVTGTRLFSLLF